MIQEFSLKNYLSIKDTQTLSFVPRRSDLKNPTFTAEVAPGVRLLRTAILYGANASGKSNILSGLDMLRNIVIKMRKRGSNTGFIPFRFNQQSLQSPGEFDIVFYQRQNKFRYYLKLTETEILEEELNYYQSQSPSLVYYRKTINEQDIRIDFGKSCKINASEEEMIRARVLPNMSVLSSLGEVSIRDDVLLRSYNWFSKVLKPIITPDTRLRDYTADMIAENIQIKKLLTEIMKASDFNIAQIISEKEFIKFDLDHIKKMPGELPEILIKNIEENGGLWKKNLGLLHSVIENGEAHNYLLEEELESRGTWRYFSLAGPLLEALRANKVLFIDELDSSLHPDLLNFFISIFIVNSKRAQLIVTVHNRELLDDKELCRSDSIWFTEKQKDGSTELYSVADITGIRKDASYEGLYKSGKFGATPNLGSIYLDLDYEDEN